jgi:hypothetical protein
VVVFLLPVPDVAGGGGGGGRGSGRWGVLRWCLTPGRLRRELRWDSGEWEAHFRTVLRRAGGGTPPTATYAVEIEARHFRALGAQRAIDIAARDGWRFFPGAAHVLPEGRLILNPPPTQPGPGFRSGDVR